MNYIVLDLEWNQAITYADIIKNPVFLTGEIIQFGAVKLNYEFECEDTFNCRVAPRYYTEIHPKVAEITHLGDMDLKVGLRFENAFSDFSEWCGDNAVILVWGTEDPKILRKNMELYGFSPESLPICYNIQNIFAAQITKDTRQYGLSRALKIVKEIPYAAHDALNDAMSTALVCKYLDIVKGLTEYRPITENKNGIVESYEFNEQYIDVEDALDDDYVVSFECPDCGEIVWGDYWVHKDGTTLISICECYDGNQYLIKLKFRHMIDGKVMVKRFVYELTEELKLDYDECLERQDAWNKYVVCA